ncbi:hypothetical protein [Nitrosomonas supralitoralis]|uniref:DUF3757 domain-containing protein n=1 Tax=Nitrosomonas supralitoralis TaxID=2116706 RepID=A0A2P7NUY9_9PROT|nr:hypothetical protein [Nitrosomonas supralitoralis]PSJ17286.1 hypothetical protein C7H79_08840 [Nitrosomonas supralitoralis]
MHKFLLSFFLSTLLVLPLSVFSHGNEEHEHEHEQNESTADSSSELASGIGWRVVRNVELGTSGKIIHMVLVEHSKYTDKTIYSAAINRLCNPKNEFCRIRFWSEERFIPEKASLTVEQNKQLRADYLVNKAGGIHQLQWSCSVDPDKNNCI